MAPSSPMWTAKMFLSGRHGRHCRLLRSGDPAHGLILLCPGAGMWFGCAQRADSVTDRQGLRRRGGLCHKMAF